MYNIVLHQVHNNKAFVSIIVTFADSVLAKIYYDILHTGELFFETKMFHGLFYLGGISGNEVTIIRKDLLDI